MWCVCAASGKVKAASGGYMKVHKSSYGKKDEKGMYGGGMAMKKKKKRKATRLRMYG